MVGVRFNWVVRTVTRLELWRVIHRRDVRRASARLGTVQNGRVCVMFSVVSDLLSSNVLGRVFRPHRRHRNNKAINEGQGVVHLATLRNGQRSRRLNLSDVGQYNLNVRARRHLLPRRHGRAISFVIIVRRFVFVLSATSAYPVCGGINCQLGVGDVISVIRRH